ncbi:hypothetical protein [Kordia sp.]|uniref:hypothetical protein n=1 Tax=Kordia sp. TaxID=1965332 RepID=UPI003B5AB94A
MNKLSTKISFFINSIIDLFLKDLLFIILPIGIIILFKTVFLNQPFIDVLTISNIAFANIIIFALSYSNYLDFHQSFARNYYLIESKFYNVSIFFIVISVIILVVILLQESDEIMINKGIIFVSNLWLFIVSLISYFWTKYSLPENFKKIYKNKRTKQQPDFILHISNKKLIEINSDLVDIEYLLSEPELESDTENYDFSKKESRIEISNLESSIETIEQVLKDVKATLNKNKEKFIS